MNNLQIFKNEEFGEVRTVTKDGEVYFVGKDVAKALGYERPTKAVQDKVDDEDKDEVLIQDSIGRMQKTPAINESGLYSLVLSSKLDSAKKFKRWVTSEVLPAIRKTGTYQKPKSALELISLTQQAILEVNEKTEAVKADLEEFKQDLPLLACDMDRITTVVKKIGVKCLGGKESSAYRDKATRTKVYTDIYDQLKRQFGVTTYKNIKRSECDTAIKIVEKYKLPLALKTLITDMNLQMSF